MHVSKTLRRLALVTATASFLGTVPFAAPAFAANVVDTVAPNAATNTGTIEVSFKTDSTFVPLSPPTVTFTRAASASDTIVLNSSEDPDPTAVEVSGDTITVQLPLGGRNPGAWNIDVEGPTSVPPAPDTTDSCDSCFTVLAFNPTVTSVAPSTVGGGATKLPFQINGSNFTAAWYCASGPCTGQPTVTISGSGVTLTGAGTEEDEDAEVAAHQTFMEKKITVAPGAATGPRDVTVTNTDGKTATCTGCLVIGPTPTLTAVAPAGGLGQGVQDRTLVLTGTNFGTGVVVTITNADEDSTTTNLGLTYDAPVRNSATQITIPNVDVTATSAIGPRRITITNTDKGQLVNDVLFDINARPTVSGVTYNDATPGTTEYGQGARSRTLTVNGANFQTGAVVTFAPATGITVDSSAVNGGGTAITLTVTLAEKNAASPVALDNHAVTVTNPDGGVNNGSTVNFVVSEGPTVTEVAPGSRGRGQQDVTLVVKGTGFVAPVTVLIDDVVIDQNLNSVGDEGTTVTVTGDVSNALNVAGVKNVSVINNADKGEYRCIGCFAVDNLQVNSMTPSTVLNDATQPITIAGSGFASNAVATFVKTGSGAGTVADIVGTTTSVNVEGTSMTATFPFSGKSPGQWRIRVTNPTTNPGVGTCDCLLTIVAPAPSITTVSPDDRGDGAQSETITLTGTGFAPGATVTFDNDGISVVGTPTVTPTQITAVINVTPGSHPQIPPVMPEQITVTNTDGQADSANFTVNAGPTTSSVAPSSRAQGVAQNVVVTGEGFVAGATILLDGTGVTVGAATLGSGQVPTEDTLTALFTIAGDAPTGARTVTVRNPDGGRSTCVCTFTVNLKPTLTGVSPAKGARGVATLVTLTGTGFVTGMTATVSGTKVTASAVTVTNATTATVTLTPAADADYTTRDVTVTNTDGGVAMKAASFKVIGKPAPPTALSATRGDASATVSWTAPTDTGNDPLTGYTVTASPGGATATVDGSTLTAVVPGLTNGTPYTFTAVATNAAGDSVASAASAPVTPATTPGVPLTPNATAGEGEATVTWTAPASNGGDAITSYTVTSTPGGLTATTPNGTTLTATVTGLTNGTAYTFTVHATNTVGSGSESAASNSVTPFTEPSAPTGVTGTPADGAVNVSWTAPATGGSPITGYTVTASPGGATANSADGSTTNAMVSGLTNGTAYTFTVTATNARGTGPASSPSAAITPRTVPGAPTNVAGTPGDGKVTVTWSAPASNGGNAISGYVVTASPGGATANVDGSTLTADVTGLTNGTEYTFTVGATNAAGTTTSAPSAAVTPRTIPGAPTGVTAERGNNQATVTWVAPSSNGGSAITGYTVTSSPGGLSASVNGSTLSATVTGLTNGTAYTFTVVATNAAGNSGSSAASNAVTPAGAPLAPTGVTATAGHTTATVSWTAPSANGSPITSYTVTSTPEGITKSVTGTSTTMTGLTDGTTYTFAVNAINAVGTGPAGTSNAVTPTTVTGLSLSATTQVVSGGVTTVKSTLVKTGGVAVAGQPVRIYAMVSPSKTWAHVRTLTTAANGVAQTTFTLTRNTKFVAVYLGAKGLDPSRSAERTTKVAYKVGANWALSGRTLTAYGSVSPNAAGRLIYLRYRRSDGALITLNYARVATNGTYRISKGMNPGTYNFFVYLPAGSNNVAGQSAFRSITIR